MKLGTAETMFLLFSPRFLLLVIIVILVVIVVKMSGKNKGESNKPEQKIGYNMDNTDTDSKQDSNEK